MVAFGPQTFDLLDGEAKERGVSVQELLRAVIIPEWFRSQPIYVPKRHVPEESHGSLPRPTGEQPREIYSAATPRTPV